MSQPLKLPQEQLVARMKIAGLRLTSARVAMAGLIALWQRPFTSAEVIKDLSRSGLGIHRATVFRDLDTLVKVGILKEVLVSQQKGRHFVISHDKSGHFLVCERCGKITPVERGEIMTVLAQWTELALEAKSWRVRTHEVESYGLCPQCNKMR